MLNRVTRDRVNYRHDHRALNLAFRRAATGVSNYLARAIYRPHRSILALKRKQPLEIIDKPYFS